MMDYKVGDIIEFSDNGLVSTQLGIILKIESSQYCQALIYEIYWQFNDGTWKNYGNKHSHDFLINHCCKL